MAFQYGISSGSRARTAKYASLNGAIPTTGMESACHMSVHTPSFSTKIRPAIVCILGPLARFVTSISCASSAATLFSWRLSRPRSAAATAAWPEACAGAAATGATTWFRAMPGRSATSVGSCTRYDVYSVSSP